MYCSKLRIARALVPSLGLACSADEPDARTTRLESIDTLHAALVLATGLPETERLRGARQDARAAIERGGADEIFVQAVWDLLSAARIGHSGIYDSRAEDPCTTSPSVPFPKRSGVTVAATDSDRCFDLAGVPIEGAPPEPHLRVEIDPADLARGVDTQLEAAAKLVLAAAKP